MSIQAVTKSLGTKELCGFSSGGFGGAGLATHDRVLDSCSGLVPGKAPRRLQGMNKESVQQKKPYEKPEIREEAPLTEVTLLSVPPTGGLPPV